MTFIQSLRLNLWLKSIIGHIGLFISGYSATKIHNHNREKKQCMIFINFSLSFIKVAKSKEKQAIDITLQYKVVNSV